MNNKVLLLVCFLTFFYLGQAQKSIDQTFLDHEILKINTNQLLTQVTESKSFPYYIQIGEYNMELIPSNIISNNYKVFTPDGEFINPNRAIPLKGYTDKGEVVRITIAEGFIYGFVESTGQSIYIEPANYYDKTASTNEFIMYDSKAVIHTTEKTCGVKSKISQEEISVVQKSSSSTGACLEIDYAVAADASYVNKYGGVVGAENKIIGVVNTVNTDYDDSFDDQMKFVISGYFLSTSTAQDPWSTSTNVDILLNSYISWANNYWSNQAIDSDVSSFWSDRDFDGSTIGYAPVGAVCTINGHNILQDFSNNADELRVLTSHELGHNFDANHDDSGSATIMAPSVANVTAWSAASVTAIDNYVASVNCLGACTPSGETPEISFNLTNSEVVEYSLTGDADVCDMDYVAHSVSLSLSAIPLDNINVTINISGSSTATLNKDFKIVSSSITFTASGSQFKTIDFEIFEDHIVESTENIVVTFTVNSGTVNIGPNTSHTITITDPNDEVSEDCCTGYSVITYGTYNYNAPTVFIGQVSDTRSRAIYTVEDLTAAGISAGPINGLALIVTTKESTQPYNNFRIGLTHTANDDLQGMSWISTDQHYIDDYSTVLGFNPFQFDTPFIWDGTSNLYIQWCFDNNSTSGTDLIQHTIPPNSTSGHMTYYQAFNGTTGCSIPSGNYSYYNIPIQPRIFLIDNLGAQAETAINTNAQTSLASGETAHLYSENNKIIASVENIGNTDIGCLESTIHSAGNGKSNAGFGNGDYSAKSYELTGDNNSLYELTLYYTDEELATWGGNVNQLNLVRSTVPLSSATENDVEIISASEILSNAGGNAQYSFKGQFSGFSYFGLTDVVVPTPIITEFANSDVVIMDSNSGLVFKSINGLDYMIQATMGNTFSVVPAIGPTMINFETGEILLNSASKGIIFKKPGTGYLKLSIDANGDIDGLPLTVLPSNNVQIYNGHLEAQQNGKSLILQNPNGVCYKLSISAGGQLEAIELGSCP